METEKGITLADTFFTKYSSLLSMLILYGNVLFFAVLTWYFDHIVESNRGRSYRPWFFLTPSYWSTKKRINKSDKTTLEDLKNPGFNISDEE